MKLSAYYNRASIISSIIVLVTGGVVYFFAINHISRLQMDSGLTEEIEEVVDYVNVNNKLPKQVEFDEDQTVFIKTNETSLPTRFFDTVYTDNKEKRNEPGRAIEGLITLNGQHYRVIITESRQSTEYLLQVIALITLALMVGLMFILFITNRYILGGLWRPFYDTLNSLKAFNVSDSQNLHLKQSRIDEFGDLNKAVQTMATRVKLDYENLKHFTENASHEMLTPLAVITAKLDALIQDEYLKPEQFDQIKAIYTASGKLTKLNQTLLLLVKIENNLIDDAELLHLDELIFQKLKQFQELMQSKNLQVTEILSTKNVSASKYLIDILLNNLLSNAIRHNTEGGKLLVTLTDKELIFQNTGDVKPLNCETLFERFQKGKKSEGTGLGLAIIKNICSLYQWEIGYRHDGLYHTFYIRF